MSVDRYSRQGFLGKNSNEQISKCRVAVIGLGGGGSHIVQALAYLGFMDFLLCDPDIVEESNLNRLIGATLEDVINRTPKVDVAERLIRSIQPNAKIVKIQKKWQTNPEELKFGDLIFGCLDGYGERQQLEAFSRRFVIPYIDIGLDVHIVEDEAPQMAGQVILSMPDEACMWCMGYLSDEKIGKEAAKYGHAGPRAQVVHANGVLANTAVGLAIDLITDWTKSLRKPQYLLVHSNTGVVKQHPRLEILLKNNHECPHFKRDGVGDLKLVPV